MSWLVRGTRPDLGFRIAVLQQSYADDNMTVNSILDYNQLVNDARRDNFDIVYYVTDVATAGVVAIGDASFANVGKNKTESQAGWVLMLVENDGGKFFTNWEGKATLMRWRSHKLKRRVRSTLAAEKMAATEAC